MIFKSIFETFGEFLHSIKHITEHALHRGNSNLRTDFDLLLLRSVQEFWHLIDFDSRGQRTP